MRGPVTIQGVRDPMGVRDSAGVRTSMGGPESLVARAERLLLPEPLSGGQGSGLQGSGCSAVVKDNHEAFA